MDVVWVNGGGEGIEGREKKRMSAVWQWEDGNVWQNYGVVDSVALEAAFQAHASHQSVCNGGYKVTFAYTGKKYHSQQNVHTKYYRNVRRLEGGGGKVSAGQKPSLAPVYVIDSDSEGSDLDEFVVVKGSKGSKGSKGVKKSKESMEEDENLNSDYPEATEINPVWDFRDPKTREWTRFSGAYTKMVEGLSKRSGIFSLNIPGIGGYQVILERMKMKSVSNGEETEIRRTPELRIKSASPKMMIQMVSNEGNGLGLRSSGSSGSSGSSSIVGKGTKKKSSSSSHPSSSSSSSSHPSSSSSSSSFILPFSSFDVNDELISKCKKATSWKVISSSKDLDKIKDSSCVICCDSFGMPGDKRTVVHLSKCGSHHFHENCIAASFKPGFISCPVCQTIYGIRTGTQPKGTMKVTTSSSKLPGFESYGTITIQYSFKDGIQDAHHPSPGQSYSGTSRTAYLPDSPQGNQVLKLLQLSFNRNLTFTIGTSVTTGASNCVIWNGIHHKTSTSGGSSNFGYPDPSYLDRVTDELKAKGVTLD